MENKQKRLKSRGEKQTDVITNQNEGITNQNQISGFNHEDNYDKEIFEELLKERFDEIKELTDEINQNDLRYFFKGSTARKRFDDFNNGIEYFKK